jgi:hypothetical protein
MQRLCTAMGIYKAPKNAHNDAWAKDCLVDLGMILDEIAQF